MLKIKKIIVKYKFQIILIIIFIISAISIYIQDKDRKESININSTNIERKDSKIGVYISGEINGFIPSKTNEKSNHTSF